MRTHKEHTATVKGTPYDKMDKDGAQWGKPTGRRKMVIVVIRWRKGMAPLKGGRHPRGRGRGEDACLAGHETITALGPMGVTK